MDQDLEKALEFANFSVTLNNQKKILKEKYQEDLVLFYANGMFKVTYELYNFVHSLNSDKTIVVDDNDTPIVIEDLEDFKEKVKFTYSDATNKYFDSYQKLTKQRSVGKLVND